MLSLDAYSTFAINGMVGAHPIRAPVDTSPGLWPLERNTRDHCEAYLGRITRECTHSQSATERLWSSRLPEGDNPESPGVRTPRLSYVAPVGRPAGPLRVRVPRLWTWLSHRPS